MTDARSCLRPLVMPAVAAALVCSAQGTDAQAQEVAPRRAEFDDTLFACGAACAGCTGTHDGAGWSLTCPERPLATSEILAAERVPCRAVMPRNLNSVSGEPAPWCHVVQVCHDPSARTAALLVTGMSEERLFATFAFPSSSSQEPGIGAVDVLPSSTCEPREFLVSNAGNEPRQYRGRDGRVVQQVDGDVVLLRLTDGGLVPVWQARLVEQYERAAAGFRIWDVRFPGEDQGTLCFRPSSSHGDGPRVTEVYHWSEAAGRFDGPTPCANAGCARGRSHLEYVDSPAEWTLRPQGIAVADPSELYVRELRTRVRGPNARYAAYEMALLPSGPGECPGASITRIVGYSVPAGAERPRLEYVHYWLRDRDARTGEVRRRRLRPSDRRVREALERRTASAAP